MKTIYKTTLSIFLFSILMVFGAKTAMGANLINHCVDSNLCFNTLYQGKVSQLKSIIADNVSKLKDVVSRKSLIQQIDFITDINSELQQIEEEEKLNFHNKNTKDN